MPHATSSQTVQLEGQAVRVAVLETVDFAGVLNRQPEAIKRLLQAAEKPGFFYLDMTSEPSNGFLSLLDKAYAYSQEYFEPGEKMASFEMRRDDMEGGTLKYPEAIANHTSELEELASRCHMVNKELVSALSDALGLEGENRLESRNRDARASDTALNFIYAPAKPKLADAPDTTHTDTGTITSLFCNRWGIQIEDPDDKSWAFCEPKAGCALVNVADSLQSLSKNRLRSCRHRHTQPVDGFQPRYFIVAYLRPEIVSS